MSLTGGNSIFGFNARSVKAMARERDLKNFTEVSALDYGFNMEIASGNAAAVERAATAIAGSSGEGRGQIIFPQGLARMDRDADMPFGVGITGSGAGYFANSTKFVSVSGGTYRDVPTITSLGESVNKKFLFWHNIDPNNPTTWLQQFTNLGTAYYRNFSVDGTDTGGISFIYCAGTMDFENISSQKVATLIQSTNDYQDNWYIEKVTARLRANQNDFFVSMPMQAGDGHDLKGIMPGYTGNQSGVCKGLYGANWRGAIMKVPLNGISELRNVHGVTITGAHNELGTLIIDGGSGNEIHGNCLYNEAENGNPITVKHTDSSNNQRGSLLIRNNAFIREPNRRNGYPETMQLDVLIDDANGGNAMKVTFEDNIRTESISGALSASQIGGIKIGDTSGEYSDLDRYSHLMDKFFIKNSKFDVSAPIPDLGAFAGFISASVSEVSETSTDFKGATGEWRFRPIAIIDSVRAIGQTSANGEFSVTLTNGGNLGELVLNTNGMAEKGFKIRCFVASPDVVDPTHYNYYVDFTPVNLRTARFDGKTLASNPLISRPAAVADTINNNGLSRGGSIRNGVIDIFTDAFKPSTGTWKKGDRVRLRTLSAPNAADRYLKGYIRNTDGSGHTLGTDWFADYGISESGV